MLLKFFARANQYCISLNWNYNLHQLAYIYRSYFNMLLANYQLIVVFLLEVWFILLFSEHNKILPCTTKSFIELIGQYIFTIAKNLWHCSCVLINVSPWLVAKVSLIFRDTFLHGTEGVRREYGTMISQNSQRYLITNIWQNKLVFCC